MPPPLQSESTADMEVGLEQFQSAVVSQSDVETKEELDSPAPGNAPPPPKSKAQMWSTFSAFMISILLSNLDQTIVATALPRIVSQFDALPQAAWVATAYLMTFSGFMLIIGQVLTLAPAKKVYLSSIFVFGIGSLICAVARSFPVLVFGRAFAGCGGGGVVNSVLVMITEISTIEERPILFGLLGGMYALASIVGPLLGGAFTDRVSWRWCFYINLPVTGVVMAVVVLVVQARPAFGSENDGLTGLNKWIHGLDWIGGILCLGTVVVLLIPLQWGGSTKPWNSAVIIALLCTFGVLLGLFLAWQYRRRASAILPLFLFVRRTQLGATLESFFVGMGVLHGTYYLPLWYQAQGHSATKSGLDILPFMLSVVTASVISGTIIKMTGRYWHLLVISPLLASVGAGLLSTLTVNTPNSHAIGFQILYGFGLGGAMQNVYLAVQAELANESKLIPQATTVVTFAQVFGGVIGVAIGGTVFANQLRGDLHKFAPQLPAALVAAVEQSVTAIALIDPAVRPVVLKAYTASLSRVFLLGVPAGALASFSGSLVKNLLVKADAMAVAS